MKGLVRALAGRGRSERGAVLVHVTIAMIGLLAFSAFAIDYGVMWTARRQAQNAADAAALAGAISMAYIAVGDEDLARQSALTVAAQNPIWGAPPDISAEDVTFIPCPTSGEALPEGGTCIRVELFRTTYQRAGGNPLPVFFGSLAGLDEQGVRATATARVLFGGATNCLLPFAIPDKWLELWPDPQPWSDGETFDLTTGNPPQPVARPDIYRPPVGDDPGTGFTRESLDANTGDDFGLQMTLRYSDPGAANQYAAAGWYRPVRLNDGDQGLPDFLAAILGCSPAIVGSGDSITTENGQMSTRRIIDTINEVVNRDSGAYWDPAMNNGRGGVAGGCMEAGTCTLSPRIRPVPVYDPYDWTMRNGQGAGQFPLQITKVIGFFIERPVGENIVGRVMQYPSEIYEPGSGPESSNFIVTITLVR